MRKLQILRTAALLLATLIVAVACTDEPEFQLRDITGAMPDLEFQLERAPDGRIVTQDDFDGQVVALFFGFTHCPDYCPMTMARFAAALDGLDEDETRDIRVLFVSVDPQRDTPEVLARYVGTFGPEFVGLRGEHDTLRSLTRRYRTTFSYGEPDEHGFYDVSHGTAAFLFDRNGEIRVLARESDPVDELEHDLRVLLRN